MQKSIKASKSQIHYWIKEKAEPDLEILTQIAKYFDVTTDYLLGLENEDGTKNYNIVLSVSTGPNR